MTDYLALATEMVKPEYSGITDDALLVALNEKTVDIRSPIVPTRVKQYMISQGILGAAFVYASTSTADPVLRAACMTARDTMLNDVFTEFNLDESTTRGQIDGFCAALIAAECMTVDQKSTLYQMADNFVSWTTNIVGIPVLSQSDLDFVRNGREADKMIDGHEAIPPLIVDGKVVT